VQYTMKKIQLQQNLTQEQFHNLDYCAKDKFKMSFNTFDHN